MATLLEQIAELQSENLSVEEEVNDFIKRQRAKDQSKIAWRIINVFVAAILAIFLLVIGYLLFGQTEGGWKAPAEFLVTFISSVLLPIVTLVLGYYFGKVKSE
ncbi:hypothetical protein [Sulfuriflexus mobilis]|uniref:hypothetical protein n=1 Tax=Sulfuriflexus mobilis TaxID=1811807 RepID=UPI000F82A8D2|nr:hypothetical protein [Sulfuriflexus mobilis]